MAEQAFPVIKNVHEDQSNQYTNISVPFTDGRKSLNVSANLQKCYDTEAKELIDAVEKGVTLALIDNEWKDHLRSMDDLRTNVRFASHEQKDPLLIYKFESLELFKKMVGKINSEVASFLVKCNLPVRSDQVRQAPAPRREAPVNTSKESVQNLSERSRAQTQAGAAVSQPQRRTPVVNEQPKVGRNEPCPCGSGKKYKQCHGRN